MTCALERPTLCRSEEDQKKIREIDEQVVAQRPFSEQGVNLSSRVAARKDRKHHRGNAPHALALPAIPGEAGVDHDAASSGT
eukprot:748933-Hanusia_phi.AAC.4